MHAQGTSGAARGRAALAREGHAPRMPTPMMWLLLCVRPSAHSFLPSMRSRMSSGIVDTSDSYATVAPLASVSVLLSASTAVTALPAPRCMRAGGSSFATPFQMPPVPPLARAGDRVAV